MKRRDDAVAFPMIAPDPGKEENQSNVEAPLPAVSANTLARYLGVTPKTIYDSDEGGRHRARFQPSVPT
jgi:hypothetical protein